MYKVVTDGIVIDLLKTVKYARWLNRSKKFVLTDKTSAHGIYSSTGKTVYTLEGANLPQVLPNKVVKLIPITEAEFERLSTLLHGKHSIDAETTLIVDARNNKINELSRACKNAIENGVSVLFSDNMAHHFRLTLEDQLNLQLLEKEIQSGSLAVLYHETGKASKLYRSTDILKLVKSADSHRRYHTTYFNLLKHCVYNMYNRDQINEVFYGISLEDLPMTPELRQLAKEQHIV